MFNSPSTVWKFLAVWFGIWVVAIAGWGTHVFLCIKTSSWLFLIAGAIFFPVGIIHGIGSWFGAF